MKKFFTLSFIVFVAFILCSGAFAQKKFMVDDVYSSDPIDIENFNQKLFQEVLFYQLNSYLDSLSLEGFVNHSFFENAAQEHAIFMAEEGSAKLNVGPKGGKNVRERLISSGGTGVGSEVVMRLNTKAANEFLTYDELVNQTVFRWMSSGKTSQDLLAQTFFFGGAWAQIDESGRRVFISFYMGNYASLKQVDNLMAELKMYPTTKKYGLKPYDDAACKKAMKKMPNYVDMQDGLSVNENGEIIFKFNDLRSIGRFIRSSKDGLAVDIIQKNQFNDCSSGNIVDLTKVNYGVMTKRVWTKKIFKNNIAPGEGKRNKQSRLEVVLGHFPETLNPEDVELNLMIIKDKMVCANVPPSYVDNSIYDYAQKASLLPDTVVPQDVPRYVPSATSTELSFRIPFEQGKFDYNAEDMIPVLEALNEPSFFINKIFIEAYSSLEGKQADNEVLQRRRAESIVKSLEANQNLSIIDSIITSSNWEALKNDLKGTTHEHIVDKSFNETVEYVNQNAKALEKYLKNHRYADVTVWVTYDIEGDKEQEYVVDQFNKAVEAKNLNQALAIQKYIFTQVVNWVYDSHAVSNMRIPQGKEYVGLNMNKIWLAQFVFMDPLNEDYCEQIEDLFILDETNPFIEYNNLLCEIANSDLSDERVENRLQRNIDKMYNTQIREGAVDAINIELNYGVMEIFKDSIGYDHPKVNSSLEKIKEIINFDDITWQNSLKLSGVFINNGDYEYAIRLLEPWITKDDVAIDLVRSYISVCSKIQYKVHSNNFLNALRRLKEHDKNEFCNLFSDKDKLSYQTFLNTEVKQLYCETCK